jgi:hypothetical protein
MNAPRKRDNQQSHGVVFDWLCKSLQESGGAWRMRVTCKVFVDIIVGMLRWQFIHKRYRVGAERLRTYQTG